MSKLLDGKDLLFCARCGVVHFYDRCVVCDRGYEQYPVSDEIANNLEHYYIKAMAIKDHQLRTAYFTDKDTDIIYLVVDYSNKETRYVCGSFSQALRRFKTTPHVVIKLAYRTKGDMFNIEKADIVEKLA